jgi:hypothetical protein
MNADPQETPQQLIADLLYNIELCKEILELYEPLPEPLKWSLNKQFKEVIIIAEKLKKELA